MRVMRSLGWRMIPSVDRLESRQLLTSLNGLDTATDQGLGATLTSTAAATSNDVWAVRRPGRRCDVR